MANKFLEDALAKMPLIQSDPVRAQPAQDTRGLYAQCPYTLPKSPSGFKNIVDVINNKGYHAVYPQSFTVVSPYYSRNNITPYFNPGEGEDYAHGSITIAGMIDLVANDLPWALDRDQDIEEVIAITEEYAKLLAPRQAESIELKAYACKVKGFLQVMYKGRDRMLKRTGRTATDKRDIVSILKKILGR